MGWGENPSISDLKQGKSVYIQKTFSDTLQTNENEKIRLTGISLFKDDKAKQAFSDLVSNQEVILYLGKKEKDRYGRILAHLIRKKDGLWIQKELLINGLAYVQTFPGTTEAAHQLYRFEKTAQANQKGLWKNYPPLSHTKAKDHIGEFQIIDGIVRNVAQPKKFLYLNFDTDWKTDFTIQISKDVKKMFDKKGIDLFSLKNKKVRVRGWIEEYYGPIIKLTHPEQLEIF